MLLDMRAQLQRLLDAAEMDHPELGRLTGKSRQTFDYIRDNDSTPNAATIQAVRRVFGVSADYLLDGTPEPDWSSVRASVDAARARYEQAISPTGDAA